MSYSGIKSMNGHPWAQETPMPKHWNNLWVDQHQRSRRIMKNGGSRMLRGKWKKAVSAKQSCEILQDPEQDLAFLLLKWWLVGPWKVKVISETPHTVTKNRSFQSRLTALFDQVHRTSTCSSKQLELSDGGPSGETHALQPTHLHPLDSNRLNGRLGN